MTNCWKNQCVNNWCAISLSSGLAKKIDALSKRPKCADAGKWTRSIVNHVYWCASTSNGDQDLLLAKWDSVVNHICNIHDGHSDLFPKCLHGPLDDEEDPRDWMQPGLCSNLVKYPTQIGL